MSGAADTGENTGPPREEPARLFAWAWAAVYQSAVLGPVQAPLQLPILERGMHTATRQVLNYFDYQHLAEPLYSISQRFHDLAHLLAEELDGPEFTVSLRKLLESKDCAVRAALPRD